MRIIETCPAFSSPSTPSPEQNRAACVADPLHAVAGSWLGPVVQPVSGLGGRAPRLAGAVRCDDVGWR
jgi:hypothetical protein